MPKGEWEQNPAHLVLDRAGLWPFKDGEIKSVLDVACGLSLKSKFLAPSVIVGVDIYKPYLEAIESDVPYSVVKYDIRRIRDIFIDNSFDVVYALDIIEHLYEDESKSLMEQCKCIAKKAVVIETPKGYIPQDIDIQGYGAHEYQTHRSGWSVKELENLGFKCTVRPYRMKDIKRHTHLKIDPNVEVITGIYLKEQ